MKRFVTVVILTLVTACAAPSMDVQLAQSLGTVAAVRDTAAALVQSGRLSAKDGQYVQQTADAARALIDSAHSAGTPHDAQARLEAAQQILQALQRYITERQR